MADKKYTLTCELSDGTQQSVSFTAPQGEKGETGAAGDAGIGIASITIAEV